MRKSSVLLIVVFLGAIQLLIPIVYAHCPLCTAAIGTGIAVTRFYGVDDAIVGIWIGAFIISTALWLNKLVKKKIPAQKLIVVAIAFISILAPFFLTGITNSISDRIFVGLITGSMLTYFGIFLSKQVKDRKNKILFPFQTIIIVIVLLVLVSICFSFFDLLFEHSTCE